MPDRHHVIPAHADDTPIAISTVYLAQRDLLERLIHPLVDTSEAAEEIVHDVFVRVLRSGVVPHTDVSAYLRSAALNAARSELRRREVARRHRASLIADTAPVPDHGEECARRVDFAAISSHLDDLPARQRDVVCLRYADGLSERQVAQRLGISTGSVKTHAHRGLATLRARIAAEPIVAA